MKLSISATPCQITGRKLATSTGRGSIEEEGLAKGKIAALVRGGLLGHKFPSI